MIDIRDIATVILVWCMGITLTYGIVESVFPPFVAWRIAFSASREPLWWGERFAYCPHCVGFWMHGILGAAFWPGHDSIAWRFAAAASLGVASMLVARAFGGPLVESPWDGELEDRTKLRKEERV